MTLHWTPVVTPTDVQLMRAIRNACADGFAHFNGRITPGQQQKWWAATKQDLRAWLYGTQTHLTVAFGMLARRPEGGWWATVGVLPAHRGHNYGKQIMRDLVAKSDGPVYSAARKDNPAALRLHTDDAWDVIGEDQRLVYFKARETAQTAAMTAVPPNVTAMSQVQGTTSESVSTQQNSQDDDDKRHPGQRNGSDSYSIHDSHQAIGLVNLPAGLIHLSPSLVTLHGKSIP